MKQVLKLSKVLLLNFMTLILLSCMSLILLYQLPAVNYFTISASLLVHSQQIVTDNKFSNCYRQSILWQFSQIVSGCCALSTRSSWISSVSSQINCMRCSIININWALSYPFENRDSFQKLSKISQKEFCFWSPTISSLEWSLMDRFSSSIYTLYTPLDPCWTFARSIWSSTVYLKIVHWKLYVFYGF